MPATASKRPRVAGVNEFVTDWHRERLCFWKQTGTSRDPEDR